MRNQYTSPSVRRAAARTWFTHRRESSGVPRRSSATIVSPEKKIVRPSCSKRIRVEKPSMAPRASRSTITHSFSSRSRSNTARVTPAKYALKSTNIASRSRAESSSRSSTAPTSASGSERGELEPGRSRIESVMEVVSVVPGNGVDVAAVFERAERARGGEQWIAAREAEQEGGGAAPTGSLQQLPQ